MSPAENATGAGMIPTPMLACAGARLRYGTILMKSAPRMEMPWSGPSG